MGNIRQAENVLVRYLLMSLGWTLVLLGVIGVFLPLLPTTPFLLLAASCFAKSSHRFHHWLLNQPQLGPYIHLYIDGKGIPAKAKVAILALMWLTMTTSALLFVDAWSWRCIMFVIAMAVSIHIMRMPTMVAQLPRTANQQT